MEATGDTFELENEIIKIIIIITLGPSITGHGGNLNVSISSVMTTEVAFNLQRQRSSKCNE